MALQPTSARSAVPVRHHAWPGGPTGRRPSPTLQDEAEGLREVAVKDFGLVSSRKHVPVALAACQRAVIVCRAGVSRTRCVTDTVSTNARGDDTSTPAPASRSSLVTSSRSSTPWVLPGPCTRPPLRHTDPLVLSSRVQGDVEVGGVRERLVARQASEDDDIVAASNPLPHAVARTAHKPEPAGCRDATVDLLPQFEQVIDVVQGLGPSRSSAVSMNAAM